MRIAIMQPYLFPYIGYFQLINSVDKFVFYDDVNYIKGGWINRNRILVGNKEHLFTVPLKKSSSFNLIKETFINTELYEVWKKKFIQTLSQSYQKAPYYKAVYELITDVLNEKHNTINQLSINSTKTCCDYLNINVTFIDSSEKYQNKHLERQDRLIDIIFQEKSSHYINPQDGQKLYQKNDFKKNSIELSFIKSNITEYKQFKNTFIPRLSIIDVMMFNSVKEIREMLNDYELI